MLTSLRTITLLITLILTPALALAQPFDLIVRGGKIIDGTGNAWFYGDVGIRDCKIVTVGTIPADAEAKKTIDATGLILAPGFIDVHSHADDDVLRNPLAENFVRDGVTTLVSGNCGGSVIDVGSFFDKLRAKGSALNSATLIGHNSILRRVKGDRKGDLTPEQMAEAKELVAEAMRDGAVGLSTGLIYTPGTYSSTEEIIELAKVASSFGGIYASHMRSEGSGIMDAIDEALRIGREAGCRVEISHFKLPADYSKTIGGTDATLAKVMAAREAGQEVWLDQYPYTASSTSMSTLLPDWVREGGSDEAKKILSDPEQVKKVLDDMRQSFEVRRGRTSLAYAVVAGCRAYPHYSGKNLLQIAQMEKLKAVKGADVELIDLKPEDMPEVTMEDQYRIVIDLFLNGGASGVFHTMDEADVANIMQHPLVSIASDSGIRTFGSGHPHPRGYGTNARVLGRYVRELKLLTLEDAIRKMTSQPAKAFRFNDRGLLREGFVADLTIFNAEEVTDKATFEEPHQYSEGIHTVIVNGEVVFADGEMTGMMSGGPVLGPGVERSAKAAEKN